MQNEIRLAGALDMPRILEIYQHARERMALHGNPTQWGSDKPKEALLWEDIRLQRLYTIRRKGVIVGVFCLVEGEDPTYRQIDGAWHSDRPYATIHRVAGEGGGIFDACVSFCAMKWDYLRVDTHEQNTAMRRAIERQSFSYCGIITVEDGTPRRAYDRLK